jgi:hypothetical protein
MQRGRYASSQPEEATALKIRAYIQRFKMSSVKPSIQAAQSGCGLVRLRPVSSSSHAGVPSNRVCALRMRRFAVLSAEPICPYSTANPAISIDIHPPLTSAGIVSALAR